QRVLDYLTGTAPRQPAAFPELSERERKVLSLLAEGRSNPDIARQLYLSPKTVRNHLSNIFAKLQVADRAQAIIKARDAGLGTAERSPWPSPRDGRSLAPGGKDPGPMARRSPGPRAPGGRGCQVLRLAPWTVAGGQGVRGLRG